MREITVPHSDKLLIIKKNCRQPLGTILFNDLAGCYAVLPGSIEPRE
jgi:hypothetical protein